MKNLLSIKAVVLSVSLLLIASFAATKIANAQATVAWAQQYFVSSWLNQWYYAGAHDIAVDGSGNAYVAGGMSIYCWGSWEDEAAGLGYGFCPVQGGIIKYDSAGNVLWFHAGIYGDSFRGIAYDPLNNAIYVTGAGQNTQMLIGRLDATTGVQVWWKYYSNVTNPKNITSTATWGYFGSGWGIATDSSGNVVVNGVMDKAEFFSYEDMMTAKFDANGNNLWNAVTGLNCWSQQCAGSGVSVDSAGNVYAAGNLGYQFNPHTPIIVSYNGNTGIERWLWQGSTNSLGRDVTISPAGGLYALITTWLVGSGDSYIQKLDPLSGAALASVTVPGKHPWASITSDNIGNAYVNLTVYPNPSWGLIIAKYDSSLYQQWQLNYNSASNNTDWAFGIAVNNVDGSVYASGMIATNFYSPCCGIPAPASYYYNTMKILQPIIPISSISAIPLAINLGQTTTLSWNSTSTSACTAASTDGSWSGSVVTQNGTQAVTPTAVGIVTYTLTCNDASGNPFTPSAVGVTVAAGTIQVFSSVTSTLAAVISSPPLTQQPGSTIPGTPTSCSGFPFCGHTGPYYCPAGTIMCGMASNGYDNQGTIKMDTPLCCSLSPQAVSAGLSIGAALPGYIDSSANGGVVGPCSAYYGSTSSSYPVVNGVAYAKNLQADYGYCQSLLSGAGGVSFGTPTLTTANQTYANYYCPANSLVVAGQNAPAKNDSWNGFYCAPISLTTVTGLPSYLIPSSWSFPGGAGVGYPSVNPCSAAPCSGVSSTYTNMPFGNYQLVAGAAPAGYALGGVSSPLAEKEKKEGGGFLAQSSDLLKDLFAKLAEAITIWPCVPGSASCAQPLGNAPLDFIIEWDPLAAMSLNKTAVNLTSASPQDAVVVSNTGKSGSQLSWNTSILYVSGSNWLSVAPPSGGPLGQNASQNAVFTANSSGLAPGSYQATVAFSGTSNPGSHTLFPAQAVTVNFTVYPPTTCSPSSQPGSVGVPANFTAAGGDGTSYAWAAPLGTPSSGSGSGFSTAYSNSGNETVTVASGGTSAQCSVNIGGPSCSFSASPTGVIPPQQSALSWNCGGLGTGGACAISPATLSGTSFGPSGSAQIAPTSTTNYTLTCSGSSGNITAQTTVTVPTRIETTP